MSRYTRVRAGNDRANLYTEITDRIIADLEAGRIPWVQPWGTAAIKAPLAMPRNGATRRGYSGINVLILWGAVIDGGFSGQSWLTFRQALELGGHVRKGEREQPSSMPIALRQTMNVGAPRKRARRQVLFRFSSASPSSTRTSVMACPRRLQRPSFRRHPVRLSHEPRH